MSEGHHYGFESDEGFMRFLREFNPKRAGGMYAAYMQGMMNGATALREEVERLTRVPES